MSGFRKHAKSNQNQEEIVKELRKQLKELQQDYGTLKALLETLRKEQENSRSQEAKELSRESLESSAVLSFVSLPMGEEVVKHVSGVLADGYHEEALKVLRGFAENENRTNLLKEIISLSSRYAVLQRNQEAGLIGAKEYDIVLDQFTKEVIDLLY